MTRGESSSECYGTIDVEDHRIKHVDAEDRRVKEGIDCSSHGQPAGLDNKDSASSADKHTNIVDKVCDLIYRTDN